MTSRTTTEAEMSTRTAAAIAHGKELCKSLYSQLYLKNFSSCEKEYRTNIEAPPPRNSTKLQHLQLLETEVSFLDSLAGGGSKEERLTERWQREAKVRKREVNGVVKKRRQMMGEVGRLREMPGDAKEGLEIQECGGRRKSSYGRSRTGSEEGRL